MDRYLIFSYRDYESIGGWHDFSGSVKIDVYAKNMARRLVKENQGHAHIVDTTEGRIVWTCDWLYDHLEEKEVEKDE